MNKYNWYVITIEKHQKYYSYAIRVHNCTDLLSLLTNDNILHINCCDSKRYANMIAGEWNKGYKENGTYLEA